VAPVSDPVVSNIGSDDTTHQMPHDGLRTGELPELAESDDDRPRIRPVRFVIKIIAFVSVVYFFVLPLLPAFRDAFDQLLEVQPGLLVLGLGLQISALFCYSLLTRAALGKAGREL
jgi:Na+/melibiose symporter-like transporter